MARAPLVLALLALATQSSVAAAADCTPGSLGGAPGPVITGTPTGSEIATVARPVFPFRVAAGLCPVATVEIVIEGRPGSGPLPLDATSWQPAADLADGLYRWRVRATDASGAVAESGVPLHGALLAHSLLVDTTPPPPVSITSPAAGAVFRWRYVWPPLRWTPPPVDVTRTEVFLNGRLIIAAAGGYAPEIRLDDVRPGSALTLRVDVTDVAGHRTAGVPRSFTYAADAAFPEDGPLGFSIEGGAAATNRARVSLHLIWKEAPEARILVANDGGFQPGSGATWLWARRAVPWTLAPGGGIATRTVYVRMPDADGRPATFVDDIVFDPIRPVVLAATALPGRRLRVCARDATSGIAVIQVDVGSRVRTIRLAVPGALGAARIGRTLALQAAPRRVRVRDAAGNWSRWHQAARPRGTARTPRP